MKALVVIDMQWGIFNKSSKVYESQLLIKNINQTIDCCRLNNIPIIFLRFTGDFLLQKNSSDWELLPEIHFVKGDYIIDKLKSDAFSEPEFVNLLEKLKVDHIFISGVISHGCVQATAYGGRRNNIVVTVICDAHSNFSRDPAFVIESVNKRLLGDHFELVFTQDLFNSNH